MKEIWKNILEKRESLLKMPMKKMK